MSGENREYVPYLLLLVPSYLSFYYGLTMTSLWIHYEMTMILL